MRSRPHNAPAMKQIPKTSGSIVANGNTFGRFRQKAEEIGLRLIRAYTCNTPVDKGKYRLFQIALKLCKYPHNSLSVAVKDGRKFRVDLTTGMQETVFFHGVYEKAITDISRELIVAGDTCIDVGANFGWYTTFFSVCVGPTGSVHAFEPVPRMFSELKHNCELLGDNGNVL